MRTSQAASDAELLVAIGNDDADSFGVLYDRHAGRVYRHCARQLGTLQDAEDVTAVVFLEAWRHRGTIRIVAGTALPWLLMTATNVSRNHRRSLRRYRQALSRLPPPEPASDPSEAIVERLAFEASGAPLTKALDSLSSTDRQVVSLCLVAELPYADVADVLGLSHSAVRSRLMRARRTLRAALTEAGISGAEEEDYE